ncbi:MAG: DUF1573 domain-containing protein [Bacteroidota bacterium]
MKQGFIIVWMLFSTLISHSQVLNVVPDQLLNDFGYIKESEGKVFCVFELFNHEKFPVEITEVSTSCGCTVPFVENKNIAPGKSVFVKIAYDPTGRPGRFMRSAEIKIKGDGRESVLFVNVKGTVIEKEILKEYSESGDKLNKLYIKPFRTSVISSSDYRFLSDPSFRDFINDITYEIDLSNFTTLKIELYSSLLDENNPMDEDLFPVIKKFILSEMEKRNYTANQVGFSDNYVYDENVPKEEKALLKISSFYLNNDTINESGFYRTVTGLPETKAISPEENDTLFIQRAIAGLYRQGGTKIKKSSDFSAFIENCTRTALMGQKVYLGITAKAFAKEGKRESEQLKIKEWVNTLQEDILLALEEEGISSAKIEFTVPVILTQETKNRKFPGPEFFIARFYPEVEKAINSDSLLLSAHRQKSVFADESGIYKVPFQNLPVYFQFMEKGKLTADTSSADYKRWKKVIQEEIRKGKKIQFLIESSASADPAFRKKEPGYAARLKHEQTVALLKAEFPSASFETPVILQQGPGFHSEEKEVRFYSEFDYIKIIPNYITDSVQTQTALSLIPYIIHFNYNDFTLPSGSDIFQSFISRLMPLLDKQGNIQLIIETSSTVVPVKGISNPSQLSLKKSEMAKEILLAEIRKRGYDPMRVIITETRPLVQGPFYRPGYETSNVYEKYQYIKIIPSSLTGN